APGTGSQIIAPGRNAGAMAVITSPRRPSASSSADSIYSVFAESRTYTWGIRVFSMAGSRFCWLIHGQKNGEETGTRPTTSTSTTTTSTAVTTFTIAVILRNGLP